MADIIMLQMAHALDEHEIPVWRCPDCDSILNAQCRIAVGENRTNVIGRCHEPGSGHAWYHKHDSWWVRPSEDRGFA